MSSLFRHGSPGAVESPVQFTLRACPSLESGDCFAPVWLEGFETLAELHRSGAVAVLRCRRPGSRRQLVAKILLRSMLRDGGEITRFCNELMLLSTVRHPQIVRPYEFIEGRDYFGFTMEFVGGGTLADLLQRSNRLMLQLTLGVLADVASGLEHLHGLNVIHRDLKPENILLTTRGRAKISDLGIASPNSFAPDDRRTLATTLDYASPEYLLTGVSDARSDLYSLGVMAFEMLAGSRPFADRSGPNALRHRIGLSAPRLADFIPALPASCDDLVSSLLERHPADRPRSVRAVSAMIQAIQRDITPLH